ncbi:hypothetical protein BCR34DRAFT_494155 [Clohesyomyces aquaticus]|uniref:Zn(2)-C6 fungal-type domain-containing protein n=1 Tax=Clohesyomyces aquaticus TaxID=1231657 RepID=A0A1Y1YSV7_9PLEO|nr:hypothetical protein BCR34DRAFT_494155 [Clohesyomyces aquaticus]
MSLPAGEPAFLVFCPICNKPFTAETSHSRHVSYCRRSQTKKKGRPKSCVACGSAKVKCTFAKPQCARCESKGIPCVYNQRPPTIQTESREDPEQGVASHREALTSESSFSLELEPRWSSTNKSLSLNGFDRDSALFFGADDPILDITTPHPDMNVALAAPMSQPYSTIAPLSPSLEISYPDSSWRTRQTSTRTALTRLKHQDLAIDYVCDLIVSILKAFPRMMLRRETFAPFIHPYWHWPTLPEKLASCVSIAQLFETRTIESRPFLWRVIDIEEQRFSGEMETMSSYDTQWAIQALMIYIIMAIVDQDWDHTARGRRYLQTLRALSARAHLLLGWQACSTTEEVEPSNTWDDWIFAESNRRIGCLWFIICRVFTVLEYPCPGIDSFQRMALPSAKTLWEARTLAHWQDEKAFHAISRPFQEFGELVDAKRRPNETGNTTKLEAWETGTDKLGLLMNFAVAFM